MASEDLKVECVADYFVHLASQNFIDEETPEGVTPLKLQKLLYFAQCASLSIFGKPLFDAEIQAWKYGPVIPQIYHSYKHVENKPLLKAQGIFEALEEDDRKVIQGTWDLLGKYSASELVAITHKHDPWINNFSEDTKHVAIPVEQLEAYYKGAFSFTE